MVSFKGVIKIKAITLAAGRAKRLGHLTSNCPKAVIDLGDTETILKTQVRNAALAQLDELIVVTGYLHELIEEQGRKYAKEFGVSVRFVHNPFYDCSNNLISLWLGLKSCQGDFVVMNGDNIFVSTVLPRLRRTNGAITMVISRKEDYDEDDMKIITNGSKLVKIGKQLDLKCADAESVGIIQFKNEGSFWIRDVVERLIKKPSSRNAYWLKALQTLIQQGKVVNCLEISREEWAEMDFPEDLFEIRRELHKYIIPALGSETDGYVATRRK